MVRHLKTGRSEQERREDSVRVRDIVLRMLDAIAGEGMDAVRRYSKELDGWERDDFRLTPAEIQSAYDALPRQAIEDIAFAQAQVRGFAKTQRAAIQDVEVETLPGVVLGHRNKRILAAWHVGAHGFHRDVAVAENHARQRFHSTS